MTQRNILQQQYQIWLVVLTILTNIIQWEGLSHILWKIKNVPNHQSDMFVLAYVSSMLAHMNGM